MKKVLLYSMVIMSAMAISSCSKDDNPGDDSGSGNGNGSGTTEIQQSQQAVMFYMSGNWCGPCGLYGKPALKKNIDKHGDDLVVISAQLGQDPMTNQYANEVASLWGVNSVPTAAIGGNEGSASKIGGGASMEGSMDTKISSLIASEAVLNSMIERKVEGNKMTVTVTTKFFKAADGEYFISVYLLEDNIIDRQYVSGEGWHDPVEFDNILRAEMTDGAAYGVALADGTTAANTKVTKEFSVTLDSKWKTENLKVAAVIWKKGSNGVVISNGVVK